MLRPLCLEQFDDACESFRTVPFSQINTLTAIQLVDMFIPGKSGDHATPKLVTPKYNNCCFALHRFVKEKEVVFLRWNR